MIFYEDFVKKVERMETKEIKSKTFRLEAKKKIMWLGTGVPLLMIALLQGYMGIMQEGGKTYVIVSALLFLLSLRHLKMAFNYKVKLDFVENKLISGKTIIDLNSVERITLKRMVTPGGKKLQTCLVVRTEKKEEIIIPLIMNKKIEFTSLVKNYYQKKFYIIKD